MKLYELESEADRKREDAARPGPPDRIAAEKTTRLLGVRLSDPALVKASLGFPYGLAASWAPLYPVLRRRIRLGPIFAGLATGGSMALLVYEASPPCSGSPPPTAPTRWPPTPAVSP